MNEKKIMDELARRKINVVLSSNHWIIIQTVSPNEVTEEDLRLIRGNYTEIRSELERRQLDRDLEDAVQP